MSGKRIPREVWDAQPFGEVSDGEIARRLGVSNGAARNQRLARGIAARLCKSVWDTQPFGTISDYAIAKRLGVCATTVSAQRKSRGIAQHIRAPRIWDTAMMGKDSDRRIARTMRVDRHTVARERRRRGIGSARHLHAWAGVDWDIPNEIIAEMMGVSPNFVATVRYKRGHRPSATCQILVGIAVLQRRVDALAREHGVGKHELEEFA